MNTLHQHFPAPAALIGMLHLGGLPGTPFQEHSVQEVIDQAVRQAKQLAELGFDGLIVENMGDRPYLRREVGPEIVAAVTAACLAVRRAVPDLPLGVQILAGANEEAMAVAHCVGADFVRVEGFVFASVADEGLLEEASAGQLLRYRKRIGAESVSIVADIKKKHSSHAITADVSLAESARAAQFCGADGVIVTGSSTGQRTAPEDLREAAAASELPVLVGSGVTPEQWPDLSENALGMIVGSYLKVDGQWRNDIDPARCEQLVEAALAGRRS